MYFFYFIFIFSLTFHLFFLHNFVFLFIYLYSLVIFYFLFYLSNSKLFRLGYYANNPFSPKRLIFGTTKFLFWKFVILITFRGSSLNYVNLIKSNNYFYQKNIHKYIQKYTLSVYTLIQKNAYKHLHKDTLSVSQKNKNTFINTCTKHTINIHKKNRNTYTNTCIKGTLSTYTIKKHAHKHLHKYTQNTHRQISLPFSFSLLFEIRFWNVHAGKCNTLKSNLYKCFKSNKQHFD